MLTGGNDRHVGVWDWRECGGGAGGGGAGGGGAGGDGGAGEGSSSGLVVGALPRLLLLCIYLICTCISQGFLMVAQ